MYLIWALVGCGPQVWYKVDPLTEILGVDDMRKYKVCGTYGEGKGRGG